MGTNQGVTKKSLHGAILSPSSREIESLSHYGSSREYFNATDPRQKKILDAQWLRANNYEIDEYGRLRPLGSNANNVDKLSELPPFSSPINAKIAQSKKPVRALNHLVKKEINANRLAYKRCHDCGKCSIGKDVQIFIDSRHGNARVGSVETCASVWSCRVCRDKILKKRAQEITEIDSKWKESGYNVYMLTFTFSHSRNDILSELIGSSVEKTGLMGAIREFRSSRIWREFKKTYNYEADARALEITWGNRSGFHPHIHMLIYTRKEIPSYLQKMEESRLFKAWKLYCEKNNLGEPSRKNGIDLRKANKQDYIMKWGLSNELSSPMAKQAKGNNFSISQLEIMLIDDVRRSLYSLSLQKVKSLLKTYYNTMKGNKLITWGGQKKGEPSFKKMMLGSDDVTDADLVKIQKEELQYLSRELEIDSSSWHSIYWRGDSATIRDVLEESGAQGVIEWGILNGYDCSTWSLCDDDYEKENDLLKSAENNILHSKIPEQQTILASLVDVLDYSKPCPF